MRVGEPDDRVLAETAEGLREPEVGRSGEGGSSPGMGTRVRNPSTTKARGPGETTRRHGPRHVRARASDEARGSVPGDRLGAGRGLAQGESRLPRGRSTPGSVTGQSGWKSGSRACAGAPTSETAKKAAAIRLPRVRRRVPPVTWEPLTSPAAPARGGASSDAAPSVHQPERLPRAVRVRLDAHRPVVVGPVPAYAEADPSDPPHA